MRPPEAIPLLAGARVRSGSTASPEFGLVRSGIAGPESGRALGDQFIAASISASLTRGRVRSDCFGPSLLELPSEPIPCERQ